MNGFSTHSSNSTAPAWQAIGATPNHVTLTMSVPCDHCASPIPVNGPTQRLHCGSCQNETRLSRIAEELSLAAEQMSRMGSPYSVSLFGDSSPQCRGCGNMISIDQYIGYVGAATVIPCLTCGTHLPTFPAPAWLRAELPNALQVFGGDPDLAREQGGIAMVVDQTQSQPIAMACPSCSGGLTIDQHCQRTTACSYCRVSVFIPDELWRRLHPVKTMQRWTVTYAGELQTVEDMEEEERDAEERRERDAENAEHRKKHERSARRSKWLGYAGSAVGILVAIGVGGFFFFGGCDSKVEGSFVASGAPLTDFTMNPNRCKSGQRMGFYGVVLLSEDRNQAIKLIRDPVKGTLVQVKIPSSCNGETCKALTFDREECSKFEASVQRTNTTVNDVRLLEGHLRLDCKFKGTSGTAKADLSFKRCGG